MTFGRQRPPESTPEPGSGVCPDDQECYTLLATPRNTKSQPVLPRPEVPQEPPQDDFFDARSEAGSDGEGEPAQQGIGAPSVPSAQPRASHQCEADAQDKLSRLLAIERRCRNPDSGPKAGPAADLEVESILSEAHAQLWFCHSKDCPFVIGCMRCTLEGVCVADAVDAIQSPEQRIRWDSESFKAFELIRPHDPSDPTREDAIFTVMPAPRPVRDREILQLRWQVALPDGGGGQALIMRSFEDNELRAPDPQRVRAFTHLSGYILRPRPLAPVANEASRQPGPLEVVVVSQCDLGGALPGWFQNLARRLAKRRVVDWAHKLGDHCRRQRRDQSNP